MGMAIVYKKPSALDVANAGRYAVKLRHQLDDALCELAWLYDSKERAVQLRKMTQSFFSVQAEHLRKLGITTQVGDTWLIDGLYFEHAKMFLIARKPGGGKTITWEYLSKDGNSNRSARLRRKLFKDKLNNGIIQDVSVLMPSNVTIFLQLNLYPGQDINIRSSIHHV